MNSSWYNIFITTIYTFFLYTYNKIMQQSPEKSVYPYTPAPMQTYPELHAQSPYPPVPNHTYYSTPHNDSNPMPVYPYPEYNPQGESANSWSKESQRAYCPDCHAAFNTLVTDEPGLGTYAICTVIACVGCWYGCCLIPFCLPDFKDKVHSCPRCNKIIGKRKLI